jgi:Ca2+-binding EF-hand superfamily protein
MKPPVLVIVLAMLPFAAMSQPPVAPARVFISPSGEPFRPVAGAPDGFEAWFARVDAHRDGRIDRAEFRDDAARFFKQLDTNGDGVIDGFEVAAYERTVASELDISGQGFARGGSSKVGVETLLSDPEPVSSADVKLDSHISLAEWLAAADRRFDMLDTKHLGYLTHDELKALLPKAGKKSN